MHMECNENIMYSASKTQQQSSQSAKQQIKQRVTLCENVRYGSLGGPTSAFTSWRDDESTPPPKIDIMFKDINDHNRDDSGAKKLSVELPQCATSKGSSRKFVEHSVAINNALRNENDDNHKSSPNILQQMTCNLQMLYHTSNMSHSNASSPSSSSFSSNRKRISPDSPFDSVHKDIKGVQKLDKQSDDTASAPKSLLHAVLQQNGLVEVNSDIQTPSSPKETKKTCLTTPSEPHSNNNRDNIEGNLILYTNDIIKVQNSNIHRHKQKQSKRNQSKDDDATLHFLSSTSFQVLELLGQGTFAQVFKCKNITSGQEVAIKIVKNKEAYTRQASIEIAVFQALGKEPSRSLNRDDVCIQHHKSHERTTDIDQQMVNLLSFFFYENHLCLVFELLGPNLFDLLKRRQFRGLPLSIVRQIVRQVTDSVKELNLRGIVHCDLKPENILLISNKDAESIAQAGNAENVRSEKAHSCEIGKETSSTLSPPPSSALSQIKLIDFGSACFEGQSTHTYIQSRFYRSPEVLVGLEYDSAIDVWSLGCVAAELFLGLPILPGAHEHDQLGRIVEMIGIIPDWMLEQGTKASKYYSKHAGNPQANTGSWRIKKREDYIKSLSEEDIERHGGLSKLEQQPTNRYFKRKLLEDIVLLHGNRGSYQDKETLNLFVHFLKGVLNPDPCERWTAYQASMHPFVTGNISHLRRKSSIDASNNGNNCKSTNDDFLNIHWVPPFDPSIPRRKLALRLGKSQAKNYRNHANDHRGKQRPLSRSQSHVLSPSANGVTDMASSLSLSQSYEQQDPSYIYASSVPQNSAPLKSSSPPKTLEQSLPYAVLPQIQHYPTTSMSLGAIGAYPISSMSYDQQYHMGLPNMHQHLQQSHMNPPPMIGIPTPNGIHVIPNTQVAPIFGPQSYSGVHYGNPHHVGGDLGHALQRPGVIPDGLTMVQLNHAASQQLVSGMIPYPSLSSSYNSSNLAYSFGHSLSNSYSGMLPSVSATQLGMTPSSIGSSRVSYSSTSVAHQMHHNIISRHPEKSSRNMPKPSYRSSSM